MLGLSDPRGTRVVFSVCLLAGLLVSTSAEFTSAKKLVLGGGCKVDGLHTGTCKYLEDCPQAEEELLLNETIPPVCLYKNKVMVVCCRDDLTRALRATRAPNGPRFTIKERERHTTPLPGSFPKPKQ